MPTIENSILLNVPVDTTFRYLIAPTNFTEFCPNMIEVHDVHHHGTFAWTFKMLGVRFEGEGEVKDVSHNQVLEMHFWGGIKGSLNWRLQPVEGQVRLDVTGEYSIPLPLLPKHSEAAIIQHNQQSLTCTLTSLKTLLESKVAAQVTG